MEEDKKTNMGRGFVWTVVIISTLLVLFFAYTTVMYYSEDRFEMFLDGEEVDSVDVCDLNWNYTDLEFIPCIDENQSLGGGILSPYINWTQSPQENCENYNLAFPGFNIDNITRAEELYTRVFPKCNTLYNGEIIMPWLKGNCECVQIENAYCDIDSNNLSFCVGKEKEFEGCKKFKCSENLIIKRK